MSKGYVIRINAPQIASLDPTYYGECACGHQTGICPTAQDAEAQIKRCPHPATLW